MSQKIIIYLFIILCLFLSCDKNTANSENISEAESTPEEIIPQEPKELLINENRWIDSADGMRMRETPDSSSKTVLTIPAYAKVLLIKETGNEINLQGHTGKWSKIEWDSQTGWVFGGYLSEKELFDLSQLTFIEGEYYFPDDPYNEQYIIFHDDNTCIINENMCEGFDKDYYNYTINDKVIKIYYPNASNPEEHYYQVILVSLEELEMTKGAGEITCRNLSDPTKLLLRTEK